MPESLDGRAGMVVVRINISSRVAELSLVVVVPAEIGHAGFQEFTLQHVVRPREDD